jgi:hypothetical protein
VLPALAAGDMTLRNLSRTNGAVESTALSKDPALGNEFLIYCNDLPTMPLLQNSAAHVLDGYFLAQISEVTSQMTDRSGATSVAVAGYERAAYLALRFAADSLPGQSVSDEQIPELLDLLWRLYLSANQDRTDATPGPSIVWMTLAVENSSSFDYSKWKF